MYFLFRRAYRTSGCPNYLTAHLLIYRLAWTKIPELTRTLIHVHFQYTHVCTCIYTHNYLHVCWRFIVRFGAIWTASFFSCLVRYHHTVPCVWLFVGDLNAHLQQLLLSELLPFEVFRGRQKKKKEEKNNGRASESVKHSVRPSWKIELMFPAANGSRPLPVTY